MRWTRLSFVYLISYLAIGGAGLLVAPELALRLLGATNSYNPALARLLGALFVGLGVIVAQIARHRVEVLYPTTLIVRTVFLGTVIGLYFGTRDLLFLVLAAIIASGMVLTITGILVDRRHARVDVT